MSAAAAKKLNNKLFSTLNELYYTKEFEQRV